MKIQRLLGFLLAAPLAYGLGLQNGPRSLGGNETTSAGDFDKILSAFPSCAVNCLETLIVNTTCTFGDLSCMCADTKYFDAGTICVRAHCIISEALLTMNLTETACGRPIRDISGRYTSMNIASGVVTILLALTRLFYKHYGAGNCKIGIDDCVIFLAIIIAIPGMILNEVGLVGHGIGKDIWTLPAPELPLFAKYFFIMELFYVVQMALVKLSLSLFYLFVFPGLNVRRLLIGTAIFNVVFGVVFIIAVLVQCIPLDYVWTQYYDYPPHGKCFNLNQFAWANAGLNLAVDVWMIILPMMEIKRLKLHWKKKIGVALMFILGTFVSIISIVRLKSVVFFAEIINPTMDQWNIAYWSTLEVNIGIICTCLPTLRLMLTRMFPKVLSAGDEEDADAGVDKAKSTPPEGKRRCPIFSRPIELQTELSTATLVTDARSSYNKFDGKE